MAGRCTDLVGEDVEWRAVVLLDELTRVVLLPRVSIIAQVATERLLAPRAANEIANGSERAHRLVRSRVLEEAHQRAVTSHARSTRARHVITCCKHTSAP